MHRFLGLIACHCHFNTFSNLRPTRVKYAFIKNYSGNYKIRDLCKTLEVRESGYYEYKKRKNNKKVDM